MLRCEEGGNEAGAHLHPVEQPLGERPRHHFSRLVAVYGQRAMYRKSSECSQNRGGLEGSRYGSVVKYPTLSL